MLSTCNSSAGRYLSFVSSDTEFSCLLKQAELLKTYFNPDKTLQEDDLQGGKLTYFPVVKHDL